MQPATCRRECAPKASFPPGASPKDCWRLPRPEWDRPSENPYQTIRYLEAYCLGSYLRSKGLWHARSLPREYGRQSRLLHSVPGTLLSGPAIAVVLGRPGRPGRPVDDSTALGTAGTQSLFRLPVCLGSGLSPGLSPLGAVSAGQ